MPHPIDYPGFWTEELQLLMAAMLPAVRDATTGSIVRAAGTLEAFGIAGDWALINSAALAESGVYTYELVSGINEYTRRQLAQAMDEHIIEGTRLSEFEKSIEWLFGKERASAIATTETTRIFTEGNLRVWGESGVWGKKWVTANDELVCDICGPLDGQIIEITGDYKGYFKSEVTPVPGPPAHVNCRCYLQPVLFAPGTDLDAVPAPEPEPEKLQPGDGPKIGDAIKLGGKWEPFIKSRVEEAIRAIDSVHSDGKLPDIKVYQYKKEMMNTPTTQGQFRPSVKHPEIQISKEADHITATMVHEVGHSLDMLGVGYPQNFASQSIMQNPFEKILAAFRETSTSRRITKMLPEGGIISNRGAAITALQEHAAYLDQNLEIWARLYTQYIGTKTGNPLILDEINSCLRKYSQSWYYVPWDEWGPIEKEIDNLFLSLGWLK